MTTLNYDKIFARLDKITGLPLVRKGYRWYGACYLNGNKHGRWDKVKENQYMDISLSTEINLPSKAIDIILTHHTIHQQPPNKHQSNLFTLTWCNLNRKHGYLFHQSNKIA